MSNSRVHTELQIEPFIQSTGVDCFNSINHDRVQVLSYGLRSLLVELRLNLQPPDDSTPKCFIYCVMCPAGNNSTKM